MQALQLNLASRPFKNNTLLWVAFALALVLLVVFSVWNVRTYREHAMLHLDLTTEVSSIEDRFAELEVRNRAAIREIKKFDLEALRAQAAKANEFIRWKAFSWTRLFNLLEEIQPHGVRMSSVNPLFRGQSRRGGGADEHDGLLPVAVDALARDFESVYELEQALTSDAHFDNVHPERLERDQVSQELAFRLRFLYDPSATPEQPDEPTAPRPTEPLATPEERAEVAQVGRTTSTEERR